jgi:hypothetical protein
MTRKQELLKAVKNEPTLTGLVSEMCYLEKQMESLRKLPLIRVDKADPTKQKATPAAKMYQELLHKYTNIVKTVEIALGADGSDAESPLRAGLKKITGMTDEMEC